MKYVFCSGKGKLDNIEFSKDNPTEDKDIEIKCLVQDYGNPVGQVYITHDNSGSLFVNDTIKIKKISRKHSGLWSCHMNNSISREFKSKLLRVSCKLSLKMLFLSTEKFNSCR